MTNNGAAPEQEADPVHHVASMEFGDDGPARLDAAVWYQHVGRRSGQWLALIEIWEHPELVDKDNPVQWDAERDEQLPEACWAMPPEQARKLAALFIKAAEHAELFQNGLGE
jgi:hypothetical protein